MKSTLLVICLAIVLSSSLNAQADLGWAQGLAIPDNCVADIQPVTKANKRTAYQTIKLARKRSNTEPLTPNPTELNIISPINEFYRFYDHDFCGTISIVVNPEKIKRVKWSPFSIRPNHTPILLRGYDAFLVGSTCDTVGCDQFTRRVLVRFDKNKQIEYVFNTVHVDAVAYARSVDYERLASLIDQKAGIHDR